VAGAKPNERYVAQVEKPRLAVSCEYVMSMNNRWIKHLENSTLALLQLLGCMA